MTVDVKECPKGPHNEAEWLKRESAWDWCATCKCWHYVYLTARNPKPKEVKRRKKKAVPDDTEA